MLRRQYPRSTRYAARDPPALQLADVDQENEEATTYAFLRYWASDGGTLHLALGVDDDTSVVLTRQVLRRQIHSQSSKYTPRSRGIHRPDGAMPCAGEQRQRAWLAEGALAN